MNRSVWILEYHRWDEGYVDSVYSTEESATKALDKYIGGHGEDKRKYYSIREFEVIDD